MTPLILRNATHWQRTFSNSSMTASSRAASTSPTCRCTRPRQAVEDLEVVRQFLGVDQLHLYGESYGTQFVQSYAASHPQNVAALIVDGVVDLTTDIETWYEETTRSYTDALWATLQGCNEDPSCRADAEGDVQLAYDRFAATLEAGPITYEFPVA